jgi:type II secretion system protein H
MTVRKGVKARMRTSKAGTCPEGRSPAVTRGRFVPQQAEGNADHAGFTLLELLVVIFIVSLILAVTFPSFTFQADERVKSEANRMASILRYLSDHAVSTKETTALKVIFKERVMQYKSPDGDRQEIFETLSNVLLQSRGRVSSGEVEVLFSPTGAGESFSITLRDDRIHRTVTFNALSGRVRISEDEKG